MSPLLKLAGTVLVVVLAASHFEILNDQKSPESALRFRGRAYSCEKVLHSVTMSSEMRDAQFGKSLIRKGCGALRVFPYCGGR